MSFLCVPCPRSHTSRFMMIWLTVSGPGPHSEEEAPWQLRGCSQRAQRVQDAAKVPCNLPRVHLSVHLCPKMHRPVPLCSSCLSRSGTHAAGPPPSSAPSLPSCCSVRLGRVGGACMERPVGSWFLRGRGRGCMQLAWPLPPGSLRSHAGRPARVMLLTVLIGSAPGVCRD